MNVVSATIKEFLPAKKKVTPSGWISFNGPCCIHNGESPDTRQRAGIIINHNGGISYHCFNCGFKTGWQPGRPLSIKLRKLLSWFGVPDDIIHKLVFKVLRENEAFGPIDDTRIATLPILIDKDLPEGAKPIEEWDFNENPFLIKILQYMKDRQLFLSDHEFFWSPHIGYRHRLIIPFYHEGRIVGWTARAVIEAKAKYLSDQQVGYVFNLDKQENPNKIYCILVEGSIDAIYIEGAAFLGSEISNEQALMINRLGKINVVVPDRDEAGQKLIEQAIDRGWSVSMPDWEDGIKDIGDSVLRYGRLYTLHQIILAAEESPLKIRLRAKKWFG